MRKSSRVRHICSFLFGQQLFPRRFPGELGDTRDIDLSHNEALPPERVQSVGEMLCHCVSLVIMENAQTLWEGRAGLTECGSAPSWLSTSIIQHLLRLSVGQALHCTCCSPRGAPHMAAIEKLRQCGEESGCGVLRLTLGSGVGARL